MILKVFRQDSSKTRKSVHSSKRKPCHGRQGWNIQDWNIQEMQDAARRD